MVRKKKSTRSGKKNFFVKEKGHGGSAPGKALKRRTNKLNKKRWSDLRKEKKKAAQEGGRGKDLRLSGEVGGGVILERT